MDRFTALQILGSNKHFLIHLPTIGAVLSCNLYQVKIKGSRVQSPHCTAVLYSISYNKPRSAPDLELSLYQQSYLCREEAPEYCHTDTLYILTIEIYRDVFIAFDTLF